jgi:hypothetical protein
LPGMSKASGSIPSSKKTKLNKMKQTKKKWTKGIPLLINPTKRTGHLYYLYWFLPSVIFPTANQLISNWDPFPIMVISNSNLKDHYNAQYRRKNLLDSGGSRLSP